MHLQEELLKLERRAAGAAVEASGRVPRAGFASALPGISASC